MDEKLEVMSIKLLKAFSIATSMDGGDAKQVWQLIEGALDTLNEVRDELKRGA